VFLTIPQLKQSISSGISNLEEPSDPSSRITLISISTANLVQRRGVQVQNIGSDSRGQYLAVLLLFLNWQYRHKRRINLDIVLSFVNALNLLSVEVHFLTELP
jgi:hypothetical protein